MLLLLLACGPIVLSTDPSTGGGGGTLPTGDDTGSSSTTLVAPTIALSIDEEVVTVVHASWEEVEADETWVEYRFEGEDWLSAPAIGPGEAVLLGIPPEMAVEARGVIRVGTQTLAGESAGITTGSLPSDLLLPSVDLWDPSIASEAPYAMISVAGGSFTFEGPYWIEIFDRQGRVVWYHEVADSMMVFYPSVALDGTHIWYDADNVFGFAKDSAHLMRRTLDGRWSQRTEAADMGQAAGEGPDGSFFYERRQGGQSALVQVSAEGTQATIWDCAAWMKEHGQPLHDCYMNTTNWSEATGTVLTSMFESDTVFEIDLESGEPLRQLGQIQVGEPYAFDPPDSMFSYQHFPTWTAAGTLLVSTHQKGVSGLQVAAEYEVDDETQTLHLIWSYESTDMWATQVGEALRLENGNTVQGYGQDGGVREVTATGEIAWQATWPKDKEGYRVVGHLSLIEDLYSLNRGPD